MLFRRILLAVVLVCAVMFASVPAQEPPRVSPSLFAEMKWRNIGPHRASRTVAAAGHRRQPHTFYMAAVNGGVWKTTDAGRTWVPIFDDQPTGSIGSIAVAPSDPNIVYVGSGEGLHRPDLSTGDGIYKSTDAGRTWTRLGLNDAQQIPRIDVDPRNPNRLFVAALGHPYGPNEERGIFRSLDGGKTFQKVLYKDENTGGNDVDIDPADPNVVYATLWEERQGPWENAVWAGTGGGIFKSTDGGTTWKPLTNGLPAVIQANLAISPADRRRLYAAVAFAEQPGSSGSRGTTGIFRSDDAGQSWTRITTDTRPSGRIGGGDLPVPIPHPKLVDTVIMVATVSWKTTDGGKTWSVYKGAPGGEDYQNGWINPDNPDIILLAADQGAVVTLNGGETWSSWYNQSTAQLYHVAADNAFPYRVCSGQQESGSACVASRGNYGAISIRDWLPVGVDEYGYVAPDPLDPDIVYGGRQRLPVRSPHRAGVQRRSCGRPRRRGRGGHAGAGPLGPDDAGGLLRGRQGLALLREQLPVEDDGRRRALDADQPRPDAAGVGDAGECRQVPRRSGREAPAARRHLHDCAVLSGHPAHLGRHRRRARPRDRRRRAHVEGRDTARSWGHGPRSRSITVLREQLPVEDDGRGHALDAHQPRPDAADVGDARERRQVPRRSGREASAARRHLHRCAVIPGHPAHLGRHRRRARPRDR